jgi:hypothetical protein
VKRRIFVPEFGEFGRQKRFAGDAPHRFENSRRSHAARFDLIPDHRIALCPGVRLPGVSHMRLETVSDVRP